MYFKNVSLIVEVENSESDKECHDMAKMKARHLHSNFFNVEWLTVSVNDNRNQHFGSYTIEREK